MLKYHLLQRGFRKHNTIGDDDFDWKNYTLHYTGELEVGAKVRTLSLESGDYEFAKGELIQKSSKLPLHNNAQLLYETILLLSPVSILEIGCGGGDNLHNMHVLDNSLELSGVDISKSQLKLLEERHQALSGCTAVRDASSPEFAHRKVDLIFTQAVIMHIGEIEGRHRAALKNIFRTSEHYVVLMENWEKHHFLDDVRAVLSEGIDNWNQYYLYFRESKLNSSTKVMVIANHELDFQPLRDYSQLSS